MRCGSVLDPAFRFCPGCSLPTSGDDVLSTQIGAMRHEAEQRMRRPPASRALLVGGFVTLLAVVAGLGVLVFDPGSVERVLGPEEAPPPRVDLPKPWEPVWDLVPEGTFPQGPPADEVAWEQVDAPFHMARFEVPNHLWEEFVLARSARFAEMGIEHTAIPGRLGGWARSPTGAWHPEPGEEERPVRNVSALAVAHFCEWLTERLGEPGWEIRPPTATEWEYAARGKEGRVYPWGDTLYPERVAAPTGAVQLPPRKNIFTAGPSNVQDVDDDTSPFGIVAMGSNVEEFAISSAPIGGERLPTLVGQRIVIVTRCGASFGTQARDAEFLAKTWATSRDIEPNLTSPTVGVRLVKARRRPSAK